MRMNGFYVVLSEHCEAFFSSTAYKVCGPWQHGLYKTGLPFPLHNPFLVGIQLSAEHPSCLFPLVEVTRLSYPFQVCPNNPSSIADTYSS
jgi:hypothetical protein